ncbi:unnamed protein product, partial [Meganyctiphanes norvegica]
ENMNNLNKVKVKYNNKTGTQPEEVSYVRDLLKNSIIGNIEVMMKEDKECNKEAMQIIQDNEIKCKEKFEMKVGPIDLTGNKYECSQYDKAFPQNNTPIKHQKPPTGMKQHQCSHCNNVFWQKSYPIKHHKTHVEEKPYQCGKCDKAFSRNRDVL